MSTHADGLKILGALGKYRELIMTAYEENKGWLDYHGNNVKAIDDLVRLRLAVFDLPDRQQPRLNSTLVTLLDQSLRASRLKMVNANIGEAIEGIEFLAQEYLSSKSAGSKIDADGFLYELEANVLSLCDNLVDQARSIWRQIDSDFGSVSLLANKITLNKNTLRKVNNLLQSLDLINLESLYKLGLKDRELRSVLQVRLPSAIDLCRKDLSDALHRLNKMLFKLNQLESRARLVNDFVKHFNSQLNPHDTLQNSDIISHYAERSEIPRIIRSVEAISMDSVAAPHDAFLELEMTDILQGLRKEQPQEEPQAISPIAADLMTPNTLETLLISPFKAAIRQVFVQCLSQQCKVSGFESFEHAPEGTGLDIWLYGLVAEYSAMPREDRSFFEIEYPGRRDPFFNGNFYAKDVVICPR